VIRNATLGGIVADSATDTDVTSNTFTDWCSSDIVLSGSASGAVENNVFTAQGHAASATCPPPTAPLLSVDAAATSEVTADYDTFSPLDANSRPE
jgi:hypothetical protein